MEGHEQFPNAHRAVLHAAEAEELLASSGEMSGRYDPAIAALMAARAQAHAALAVFYVLAEAGAGANP